MVLRLRTTTWVLVLTGLLLPPGLWAQDFELPIKKANQGTRPWCIYASIEAILPTYHLNYTQAEIVGLALFGNKDAIKGHEDEYGSGDLSIALPAVGMVYKEVARPFSLDEAEREFEAGRPMIIAVRMSEVTWHIMVLYGKTGDRFIVWNPWGERLVVTREELEKRFGGPWTSTLYEIEPK